MNNKLKLIIILTLAFSFCFSGIWAQEKRRSIVDDLETPVLGEGTVHIDFDPGIKTLIGSVSSSSSSSSSSVTKTGTDEGSNVKTSGFRIQVFMSNNPRTAWKDISYKQSLIKGVFPDVGVYTDYTAPNLKLLTGDFLTKEEASVFRQKMQKAIPELGNEMYIVQDKVNIRMQKSN